MPLYEYGATTLPSEGAKRDRRSAFLVGALAGGLAGAMVMAFAWLAMGGPGSEDSSPDRDAAGSAPLTPTTLPSAGGPVNADEASTDLARCREVFDAQSAPLRAAAASLGQWEMHIGAMNKLVVGTIKLKQATQFWNQTRVGASTKLKGFSAARDPFQQRSLAARRRAARDRSSPRNGVPATAAAVRNQTLRLAIVSLGTWQEHVHHMEMLRRGETRPQEATALWLQNWQKGNQEVRAYRAAARAAKGKTC